MSAHRSRRWLAPTLLLLVATFAAYWQLGSNGFINVDDRQYILDNPHVRSGLNWQGLTWAFGSAYACNWHPLTWISHMLDCQLYGLRPGGHHLTNLLFHAANSVLLFAVLVRMTGRFNRSWLVALLFALHPLHVESVAWASERKDVLCAFFGFLSLIFYIKYAQAKAGSPEQPSEHSKRDWSLALVFFAMGLMAKPMLVTFPFVLLLLDFWPLERLVFARATFFGKGFRQAITEKIPFFALAIIVSVICFLAQQQGGAVSSVAAVPLWLRTANAAVAYVQYLEKIFVPMNLSPIYVLPDHLPVLMILGAFLVLAGCSWLVVGQRASRPYLLVGWLWFLGTLLPTIGLIQVGSQAMADRYMYLPSVGLFVAIVWWGTELLEGLKVKKEAIGALATASCLTCLLSTWAQTRYWKDGVTLFARALELQPANYVAYDHFGEALHQAGRDDDGLLALRESVRLAPNYPEGQYNLGTLLLERGLVEQAIDHLRIAARLAPRDGSVHQNLGNAFLRNEQLADAEVELNTAVRLKPEEAGTRLCLAAVLMRESNWPQAQRQLEEGLRLDRRSPEANRNLAYCLVQQGRTTDARPYFAAAASLDPTDADSHFNLGLAYLETNRPAEAATEFSKVLILRPDAKAHYRLGCALAGSHKTTEAAFHLREALHLSPDFPEAADALAHLEGAAN